MKSCATGLTERFFSVMIPIGRRVVGKSMGKILMLALSGWNLNIERGRAVRKRPVATRRLRAGTEDVMTVARGTSKPHARKASTTTDPNRLSEGGSVQHSLISSASFTLRCFAHLL